jgi:ethanolamine ammonia-lyase large subunit
LYDDARVCLRGALPADFAGMLAPAIALRSRSVDRDDYILHPPAGESFDDTSVTRLRMLARRAGVAGRLAASPGDGSTPDVWVVISDGLNAYALTDADHLAPFLDEFERALRETGRTLAPERIVVTGGRVRAGYRAGDILYETLAPDAVGSIVHLIGERPGNGHHTFSAYLTTLPGRVWAAAGTADHNHTRVVSNIADTALPPRVAARQAAALL